MSLLLEHADRERSSKTPRESLVDGCTRVKLWPESLVPGAQFSLSESPDGDLTCNILSGLLTLALPLVELPAKRAIEDMARTSFGFCSTEVACLLAFTAAIFGFRAVSFLLDEFLDWAL